MMNLFKKSKLSDLERKILYECIHSNQCAKLVQQYWLPVYYMVKKSLEIRHVRFSVEDIEDMRNEVFIRLFENNRRRLHQYNDKDGLNLNGWIRLIASQTVGMYLRKKDRTGQLGPNFLLYIDELKQNLEFENEKNILDKLSLENIQETMKKLTDLERLVLQFYFFDGLNLKDIANYLNKKENAVYQIKYRALKNLQKILCRI